MQTTVKKEKLPVVTSTTKGKVIITKELQDQIDFLHKAVGNKEWIGVLCYKRLEGDLANPSELVLECRHVYLISIDTAGHTEGTTADGVIPDLYDTVPNMLEDELATGLIHTHHSMTTFFSTEDWEELHDNTEYHNYYLSLIVNFSGIYAAKVSYIAKVKSTYSYREVDDTMVTEEYEDKKMVVIDMEIFKQGLTPQVSEDFANRYKEVEAARAERVKRAAGAKVVPKGPHVSKGYNTATVQNVGEMDVESDASMPSEITTRNLILAWLDEATEYSLTMTTKTFNSVYQAVTYLDKYFAKKGSMYDEKDKFLAYMQNCLLRLTKAYDPIGIVRAFFPELERYKESSASAILLLDVVRYHSVYASPKQLSLPLETEITESWNEEGMFMGDLID